MRTLAEGKIKETKTQKRKLQQEPLTQNNLTSSLDEKGYHFNNLSLQEKMKEKHFPPTKEFEF